MYFLGPNIVMDIATLTQFFGWSLLINSAILVTMTIALVTCKDFVSRTHSRMFGIAPQDLVQSYFNYLSLMKLAITVFNLTPYIALKIIAN